MKKLNTQLCLLLLVSLFSLFGLSTIKFFGANGSVLQNGWDVDMSSGIPVWIAWKVPGHQGKGLRIIAYIEPHNYDLEKLRKIYESLSKQHQEAHYIGVKVFTSKNVVRDEIATRKLGLMSREYLSESLRSKEKEDLSFSNGNWYESDYFCGQTEEWIIFYNTEKKATERITLREPPAKITPLSELQRAIEKGDISKIQELFDKGVSVNARENEKDWTPLMLAIEYDKVNVAEFLISKGANINLGRKDGWTPIIMASVRGDLKFVKLLLRTGTDVNLADGDGQTPLIYASRQGHYEVVRYLIKSGADVNLADNDGETALMCASGYGVDEETTTTRYKNPIQKNLLHLATI